MTRPRCARVAKQLRRPASAPPPLRLLRRSIDARRGRVVLHIVVGLGGVIGPARAPGSLAAGREPEARARDSNPKRSCFLLCRGRSVDRLRIGTA
jgi:hypothetical protein